MRPLRSRLLAANGLFGLVALFVSPLIAAGCGDGDGATPPTAVVPRPTETSPPPGRVNPYPTPTSTSDAAAPSGPGTLLVPGDVRVLAVTDNGYVAYFNGEVPTKSLEVYDVRTKTTKVLVPSTLNSDYVAASRNAIAHWSSTRGPFGHGTLRFWTANVGLVRVPGTSSLAGVFTASEDEARVAFVTGPLGAGSLGQIVHAPPSAAANAPVTIVPDFATGCRLDLRELGGRLFASTCGTLDGVATTRAIDRNGATLFGHERVKPGLHTSDTGDFAVSVRVGGGATLVATATGQSVPLADVVSAEVSHDGTFVVTTTAAGSLLRAPTTDPVRTETIATSGFSEVLQLSPDGAHAIVATASTTTGRGFESKTTYAMALVSLTAPFTVTPLLTTPTGMPRGFTASGKYVLYEDDSRTLYENTLVARDVAGGPAIAVGKGVARMYPVKGTNAFVTFAYTSDGTTFVKKVDLDAPTATTLLATDVAPPVLFEKVLYVGAGPAGLRAIAIP